LKIDQSNLPETMQLLLCHNLNYKSICNRWLCCIFIKNYLQSYL